MAVDQYHKGIRLNTLLLLSTGIVIVVSSILVYLFVLKGVYGRFQFDDLLPSSEQLEELFFGKQADVAILYSKYTENALPIGSTWLNDNITTWKKFISDNKLKFKIISDQDIEKGDHFNFKLIILPGSKSMSDREILQIKKYLEKGGSVYATGAIASLSEDGKWRGWEYFNQIFGIQFSFEIKPDEFAKIHTLRGALPLTSNIPTGFPLKVATWDRPMAAEVLDPRTTQVSFWYNYRLDQGLVREQIKKSAGIVYGNYGEGRFVWMGFELNSIIGSQEDYIYLERLFNNSINWLTYSPIAYVKDWPVGYEAAAVITPVLSSDITNISNILPILSDENIKATFFVDPQIAQLNRSLVAQLGSYGEIGALLDLGYLSSVNDRLNSLNSLNEQTEKLINANNILSKITNSTVSGVLPYYGLFDNNTISAAIKSNYKYIITDSLTDRSVPKTIIRGDDRILTMTKTARDDYEVVRDFGLTLPEFQFYTYQEDLDRVLFEGGMYIFKFHTEFQCRDDYKKVIRDIIQDLKKKRFWITTASEIQKWYEKRDFIEIRTEKRSKNRIALKVSNPGVETITNLVIDVDLNERVENLTLESEIIGTKPAIINHPPNSKILYLQVQDLKPGESRIYYIDYDRITS